MRKKIKMFLFAIGLIALIASSVYFGGGNSVKSARQSAVAEYKIFLNGNYAVSEKSFKVKKGVVIFSAPEEIFLVKSPSTHLIGRVKPWVDEVRPWSKIVFITVTYRGVTKKLSAKQSRLEVPLADKIILRIAYNPQYFNPLTDEVFTGKGEIGHFRLSPMVIKLENLTQGNYKKSIPELSDLPETSVRPTKAKASQSPQQGKEGTIDFLLEVPKKALGLKNGNYPDFSKDPVDFNK